jgi:isopentenyldiphosphate isomerase
VDSELQIEPHFIGMRRAAVRRTLFELGINDLTESDMTVVSRILYYADACETFAEYELDYIIFAKKDIEKFNVNEDEVMDTRYVSLEELESFI